MIEVSASFNVSISKGKVIKVADWIDSWVEFATQNCFFLFVFLDFYKIVVVHLNKAVFK